MSMDVADCPGLDLFQQVHGAVNHDRCFAERLENVLALIGWIGCNMDAKWHASSKTGRVKVTGSKTVHGQIKIHEAESGDSRCCVM
jgi:hypothetical protein